MAVWAQYEYDRLAPSIQVLWRISWLLLGALYIGTLIAGVGICLLKSWARVLEVWLALAGLIHSISFAILFDKVGDMNVGIVVIIWGLGGVAWNAWLLWTFTRPELKAQFRNSK